MNSDFIEYDVFISNDLDEFKEENIFIKKSKKDIYMYHKFHNPNINLSTATVDLYNHIDTLYLTQLYKGSLYTSVCVCVLYDQAKYKNMNIIPKLSRRQKAYNEYIKKIRYPFFKLKENTNVGKENIQKLLNIPCICDTIPEYLKGLNDIYKQYHYSHIEKNINQFKLSLLYGYPIICGIKEQNAASVIIGFDNDKVKFINTQNNEYSTFYIPIDEVLKSIFDPCVVYSNSGCGQEINLGFQR